MDEATRLALAKTLLDTSYTKAQADLSQAIQERDSAWLLEKLSDAQETLAQTKIESARKRVAALAAFDPAWIPIAESRKLGVVAAAADQELFTAVAPGGRPESALKDKMQSLVYGDLSQAGGYLVLRLAVWDWVLGKQIWQDDWVIDPKMAQDRIGDQLEAMTAAVLGQAGAGLRVTAQPKAALVTLRSGGADPKVVGQELGGGEFRFLPPGDYQIEVSLDGYVRQQDKLSLVAATTKDQAYQLEPQAVTFFYLESEPTGARVYYDNRYCGVTPTALPVPDPATAVYLELEGYRSTRLVVPPQVPPVLHATLYRDLINWKDETKLRRDKTFDALAWLTISIIPPLFFNGLYRNISSTIATDGPSDNMSNDSWSRLVNQGNLFYYLSLGTLAITGALSVNFGINLASYLSAADLAAGN